MAFPLPVTDDINTSEYLPSHRIVEKYMKITILISSYFCVGIQIAYTELVGYAYSVY